jgi:hypothetical protein
LAIVVSPCVEVGDLDAVRFGCHKTGRGRFWSRESKIFVKEGNGYFMRTSGTLVFAYVTITGPDVGPRTDTDSEPRFLLTAITAGIYSVRTLSCVPALAHARASFSIIRDLFYYLTDS